MTAPALLVTGPVRARATLLLAHGAGSPMDSPFLESFAQALAGHHIRVARFEFAYMAERRTTGRRRLPDRLPRLCETFRDAVAALRAAPTRLWLGGKSLGGRVATLVAHDVACAGVAVLGYPFHPPRRPDRPRVEHLATIPVPCLILQGERDPFGTPSDVATYGLASTVQVSWIADGDHSFEPRRSSGQSLKENIATAAGAIAAFVDGATRP